METAGQDNAGEAAGTIVAAGPNLRYAVRLDGGREVDAVLTRAAVRDAGCIAGSLIGWAVRVRPRAPARPYRITRLDRPPAVTH